MRFERKHSDKRYKVVSKDGVGLTLAIPRYVKTDVWMGTKNDVKAKGFLPKGTDDFYTLPDGTVVIDGFLAVPNEDNIIEMKVRGNLIITARNWWELKNEIESLLDYGDTEQRS